MTGIKRVFVAMYKLLRRPRATAAHAKHLLNLPAETGSPMHASPCLGTRTWTAPHAVPMIMTCSMALDPQRQPDLVPLFHPQPLPCQAYQSQVQA